MGNSQSSDRASYSNIPVRILGFGQRPREDPLPVEYTHDLHEERMSETLTTAVPSRAPSIESDSFGKDSSKIYSPKLASRSVASFFNSTEPSGDISVFLARENSSPDLHGEYDFEKRKRNSRRYSRQPALVYSPIRINPNDPPDDSAVAYAAFLKAYPQYQLTWVLDTLRKTDFARLDRNGETYVDFMGGALYPESLIRVHTDFLNQSILGNTHSVSNRYECQSA
jgi:molybdenum cofactor sulfurtransferase